MTNDNQDALSPNERIYRLVDKLMRENEAKDALLRQAVEALEEITPYFPGDDKTRDAALASIYQHLEGKA